MESTRRHGSCFARPDEAASLAPTLRGDPGDNGRKTPESAYRAVTVN
jgi:hypothetical protein